MIAPEHQDLKLSDFYYRGNFDLKGYDYLNIEKPIGMLTLTDLDWCLRRRQFLESIVEIILDKIEENQVEIDQNGTEICSWYYEVIKEIITIPFSFWDDKHVLFSRYCTFISKFFKSKIVIEGTLLQLFLAYKPKSIPIYWTEEDGEEFIMDCYYDLLGNLMHAIEVIKELKYALLNGQSVFIVSEFKKITTVQQLIDFIWEEYGFLEENNGFTSGILDEIEGVKKIKFIETPVTRP